MKIDLRELPTRFVLHVVRSLQDSFILHESPMRFNIREHPRRSVHHVVRPSRGLSFTKYVLHKVGSSRASLEVGLSRGSSFT